MAANGMKNDVLQVDQKLTIPAGPVPRGPDGQIVPTVTPTPKSGLFKVLVQEGDTIDSIAKRMGSSIEAIVQANEAIASADTIIRPGDLLNVPVGTVTFTPADQSSAGATATFVPTPTPTPGLRWPAPQLMTPLEGAAARRWRGPIAVAVGRVVEPQRGLRGAHRAAGSEPRPVHGCGHKHQLSGAGGLAEAAGTTKQRIYLDGPSRAGCTRHRRPGGRPAGQQSG